MTKEFKFNKDMPVDLEKLIASRLLIQANSGGGKSWTMRRILEQTHGKVQQIIIDPEGEFSTLRENLEYIYVAKNGDIVAEPKSAALLARKLLEFNASAIIDLYELHPQERKHFVRLFLDAMVNSPKELHHPCLVVIDEIHTFAPEKGQSEALDAVIGLASIGRKREFCLIGATQRISKLHKDVAAECNNKLIGRTGLDIDMKRAAEELGFTTKEQMLSLRSLNAGEFYAFGPAISKEVVKTKIGEVKTSPPKVGKKSTVVAKPTESIKRMLEKLGDLPTEAKKEIETIADLKQQVKTLTQQVLNQNTGPLAQEQEAQIISMKKQFVALTTDWEKVYIEYSRIFESMQKIHKLSDIQTMPAMPPVETKMHSFSKEKGDWVKREQFVSRIPQEVGETKKFTMEIVPETDYEIGEIKLGICEKNIYGFLLSNQDVSFSKFKIAVMVGYSFGSGGFNNALAKLSAVGLIVRDSNGIRLGKVDYSLGAPSGESFSLGILISKLPKCEASIMTFFVQNPFITYFKKDEIGAATGYSTNSGGFNNALARLNRMGLIKRVSLGMCINPELLEI